MKTQSFSYTPIQKSLKRAKDSLLFWFDEGKRVLDLENYPLRKLAAGVGRLSSILISGKRKAYMDNEELFKAYFSFFFPQGFYRTYFVLDEILRLTDFSPEEGFRINDYGTGPGSSLLAAHEVFKPWKPELSGVESSLRAINFLRVILEKRLPGVKLIQEDFTRRTLWGDIAIFSSALSEVGRGFRFIERIIETHKILVVIEPGWKQGYELIRWVSRLLKMNPLLPCFGADCSLHGKDWCHAALPFSFPELTLRVNSFIGHKLRYLKFTYGVFAEKIGLKKIGARIISPPLKEKGKESFLICEKGQVIRIERLKNQPAGDFDKASCCDLISYEGERKGSAIRLKELKIIK